MNQRGRIPALLLSLVMVFSAFAVLPLQTAFADGEENIALANPLTQTETAAMPRSSQTVTTRPIGAGERFPSMRRWICKPTTNWRKWSSSSP